MAYDDVVLFWMKQYCIYFDFSLEPVKNKFIYNNQINMDYGRQYKILTTMFIMTCYKNYYEE